MWQRWAVSAGAVSFPVLFVFLPAQPSGHTLSVLRAAATDFCFPEIFNKAFIPPEL